MPFDPTALQRAAEEAPTWDEPPPSDRYEAELILAEPFVSRQRGEDMLRVRWRVLTGALRDHEWSYVHPLEAEAPGLNFTAEFMTAVLGTDAAGLAGLRTLPEIGQALKAALGTAFEVEVKRNGSYTNTYVQRRLGAVQTEMPVSNYGRAPAAGNAIYQGEDPPPRSDIPESGPDEFVHPPQKGDIDPATGEPIPF